MTVCGCLSLFSETGKSRGLFWLLVPGLVVLTKASEQLSAPTPWNYTKPVAQGGASLHTRRSWRMRLWLWCNNVVTLILTILMVLVPSVVVGTLLALSVVPNMLLTIYMDWVAVRQFKAKGHTGTAGRGESPTGRGATAATAAAGAAAPQAAAHSPAEPRFEPAPAAPSFESTPWVPQVNSVNDGSAGPYLQATQAMPVTRTQLGPNHSMMM